MMYSIILPVYNESENIYILYDRLSSVMKNMGKPYEIMFVNDGSVDETRDMLTRIHDKDRCVKVINFSRNFGHQMAVTAGLTYCSGEYIAVIDADLQDPPEILPRFFAKLEEGNDVVYAIRTHRKEGIIKRLSYFLFYRILRKVANISIPLDSGDFCVMRRRVVEAINAMPERNRFIRGLRSFVGFIQVGLEYERDARIAGKSKYTFRKLMRLAFDGIVSFSYVPLQILTVVGFLFFILSIVGSLATVYFKLFTSIYIPRGFPTTIIAIMFIGGMNMLALGTIGEYIGRIYDEVKRRHPYIIESSLGIEKSKP